MEMQLNPTRTTTSSNVVWLNHFEGIDGATTSNAAVGVTPVFYGAAQIDTSKAKFGTSSLLLNGSTSYISLPDTTNWDFKTNDFTMDCQIYIPAAISVDTAYMMYAQGQDSTHYAYWYIGDTGGQKVLRYFWRDTTTLVYSYAVIDGILTTNTWHHVAVVRHNGVLKQYFNGNRVDYTHSNDDYDLVSMTADPSVGASAFDSAYYFNGNIDEFRVVNGTACWTDEFTPPTSKHVHDIGGRVDFAGYQEILDYTAPHVMINFNGVDGAQTYQAETWQDVTFYGTAQLDTDQKKFGISSVWFDGNSDYVSIPNSTEVVIGNNDFTLSAWIRLPSPHAGTNPIFSHYTDGDNWVGAFYDTGLNFQCRVNGVYTTKLSTNVIDSIQPDTWTHIAFVRKGVKQYIFLDGIRQVLQAGQDVVGTIPAQTGTLNIGLLQNQTGANWFNGWLDNYSFHNGTALWTEDFIPPQFEGNNKRIDLTVDGDSDKEYLIYMFNPSYDCPIQCVINNDTSTKYGLQRILDGGGNFDSQRMTASATWSFICLSQLGQFNGILKTPRNGVKTCFQTGVNTVAGKIVYMHSLYSHVYNDTSNVTSLNFLTYVLNPIYDDYFCPGTHITVLAGRNL